MAKKSFYEIGSSEGYLREGFYLEVRRQINYRGDRADFKPFLNVPVKDLEKQLKESQAEEKKVFEEMKKAVTAWDEHGAQTLLLQKAIEYLKTPEVTHTRNEWQRHKDGSWEISNLVYKMTFNIVKSGDEWKLTWELSYTAPGLSQGYWGYTRSPRERIEYEGSKKYKTMEGAQKYIQSKFDQYAPCFESLSPPIPAEAKELFCVNGQLLQGYSLQPPVPQKEKVTLEDLLNCLEDGDMAVPSEAQPVSGEPAPPAEEKTQAGRPSRSRSRHRRRTGGNRSRLRPKPPAQPPGKSRCIKSGWLWRDRGRAWHIRISPLDGKSKCPPITIQIKRRTVLRN